MSFSKYSPSNLLKNKGFIFSIEALIALILFVGFLQIAHFNPNEKNNYLTEIAIKNALSDALTQMDNTGFAAQTFDANVSDSNKGLTIYSKLASLLPANVDLNVSISSFDSDPASCKLNGENFSSCFVKNLSISSNGSAISGSANVLHEKSIFVSRKGPQSCSLSDPNISLSSQDSFSKVKKASFDAYLAGVFFAQTPDFNINFGTIVTPPDRATCDQNIRVDLNAWLPNDMNTYGRHPADIMLLIDKSGSMSWDGYLGLTNPHDIFVLGDYAYVADQASGLRDVNIQNPLDMTVLGTFDRTGATSLQVQVNQNTAYLAQSDGGLDVVDVSNKINPQLIKTYAIGTTNNVFYSNNYLYAVTSTAATLTPFDSSAGAAQNDSINIGAFLVDTSNDLAQNTEIPIGNYTVDTSGGLAQNAYLTIGRNSTNYLGGQSFIPTISSIQNISLQVMRTGSPSRDLNIFLRSSLTGPNIASTRIAVGSVTTSYTWINASFASPVAVNPNSVYYIVLGTDANNTNNYYRWATNSTGGGPYSSGSAYQQSTAQSSDAFLRILDGTSFASQSFIPNNSTIQNLSLYLIRTSTLPANPVTVSLRATLNGTDLATTTIPANSIGTTYGWINTAFASPISVTPQATYYLVLTSGTTPSLNHYHWGASNTNPYPDGNASNGQNQIVSTDLFLRLADVSTSGAESFVPNSAIVQNLSLYLSRTSTLPANPVTISLRATLNGTDLATTTIPAASIGTAYAWINTTFPTSINVTPTNTYYIVLSTGTAPSQNHFYWGANNTNPYSNGNAFKQQNQVSSTDAFVRGTISLSAGLQLFDTSSSPNLFYLSSYPITGVTNIFVDSNYVYLTYLTSGTYGLRIVNCTNKTSPTQAANMTPGGTLNSVYVSGNYAYVAAGTTGLHGINVQDPQNPNLVKTTNTAGTAYDAFYYSDGNVYVADGTSLLAYNNATDLSSSTPSATFSTTYNYQNIKVSNDWAFLIATSQHAVVAFNIHNGPKINQVKVSAANFVDFNGWKTVDQMGLVSYNTTSTTNQTLRLSTDANKTALKTTFNTLVAGGGTNLQTGISAGTTVLTGVTRNPIAIKFEILLSDGQSDSGTYPLTAAQQAHDSNIKIYTIGFGGDTDTTTLKSIASITDGNYYYASDANALSHFFNQIAIDIGDTLSEYGKITVNDSNIMIPLQMQVTDCNHIIDKGNGKCETIGGVNYLDYNIGKLDNKTVWRDSFTMNIPCNELTTCGITHFTLPFSGTTFWWRDTNNLPQRISWDSNRDINFDYRQVGFSVSNATSSGLGSVTLDINVFNSGKLDANNITIGYSTNSPPPVTAFQSNVNIPVGQSTSFKNQNVNSADFFIALVPTTGVRSWCPVKTVEIKCTGEAKTVYYVVSTYAWIK